MEIVSLAPNWQNSIRVNAPFARKLLCQLGTMLTIIFVDRPAILTLFMAFTMKNVCFFKSTYTGKPFYEFLP